MDQLNLSESEWRKRLSPEQFHVLREAGTERAFSGRYNDNKADGLYRCAACQLELFDSTDKYDSGSGWPSFTRPIAPTTSSSMPTSAMACAASKCAAHAATGISAMSSRWPAADRAALLHEFGEPRISFTRRQRKRR